MTLMPWSGPMAVCSRKRMIGFVLAAAASHAQAYVGPYARDDGSVEFAHMRRLGPF